MNIVIDPYCLFISDDDWTDEDKQDDFIERLRNFNSLIQATNCGLILWCEDYDLMLWEYPIKAPWHDNQAISSVYNTLLNGVKYMVDDDALYELSDYEAQPSGLEFDDELLQMMHYCITTGDAVALIESKERQFDFLVFKCSCHSNKLIPKIVYDSNELLDDDELIDVMWPMSAVETEGFYDLIVQFSKRWEYTLLSNKFTFSPHFIQSIISKECRKKKLIEQILRRLSLTQAQAVADGSLQDEYIVSINQRRFRVTQRPTSTRIHYIYNSDGVICFKEYYAPGEHDDGL